MSNNRVSHLNARIVRTRARSPSHHPCACGGPIAGRRGGRRVRGSGRRVHSGVSVRLGVGGAVEELVERQCSRARRSQQRGVAIAYTGRDEAGRRHDDLAGGRVAERDAVRARHSHRRLLVAAAQHCRRGRRGPLFC